MNDARCTPARLSRARKVRERKLDEMTEIYRACQCTWPLDNLRNRHGHDSECPAVRVIEAQREAALDREAAAT